MDELRNKKRCKIYKKQIVKWQKFFLISNQFKHKWSKFSNQKGDTGKMD